MSPKGFRRYAKVKFGVDMTLDDAKQFVRKFYKKYSSLIRWHQRMEQIVRNTKQVRSIIGRIRHLPDIDSTDDYVQEQAIKQAINSPIQAVPPALSFMALAEIEQLPSYGDEIHCICQVHDSLLFEVREDVVDKWAAATKKIMENPPLKELFNVELSVPIVADVKVGRFWGEGKEWKPKEAQ